MARKFRLARCCTLSSAQHPSKSWAGSKPSSPNAVRAEISSSPSPGLLLRNLGKLSSDMEEVMSTSKKIHFTRQIDLLHVT